MERPILQVALDLLELKRAIEIAGEAIEGGADWLEAGTPLIKSEGMNAIRELKKHYRGHKVLADMKTIDTGAIEVEMAAKSGADIVIILALSDDDTIAEAIRAARKYGCEVMADLINVPDPASRAKEVEELGVDYLNVHVGIDQQMKGLDPLEVLKDVVDSVSIPVAAAGGLDAERAAACVSMGASIVIVGSNIVKSRNVTESARKVREAIDRAAEKGGVEVRRKSLDEEIRELLMRVSTPNVSDAMHRAKAMDGVYPLVRGKKIVGKAVTVSTMDGDWAKPVEAINVAGEGDVLVIKVSGDTAAVWGELATRSCINRKIAGVIIDGAVRDVDDIRELGFPLFARKEVPNAGEPKGFGEINVKVICGGVEVNPGDWIIADDNGVMVIPKRRAYEIARRAMEVKKSEDRIRGEIEEKGRTLADVVELYKWEKVQ
ncbi:MULTISPECIES: 3-hexulose-6-phosphate synthase [Archaeoglobus]|uniref:3-hexulose-6-phosphate synthase n=3 Tax=Archaeoglobus fulgidus TaxID=2234 RepID=O29400_ARCFU|nr:MULTISPECIES: 3-hexulose-6-phosphate synthase [Archaeoglobus]AAB90381.1 D-arabino 3-hexulose 6-phosphate formaldehyde lyase (hps-1) [Archaeoglobus fulgidus DSM 4304]AIG97735.1 3-hexulose-6-phosphate synthase [Archaeoglobus fulgidus DSM 8774]KUJ93706.1 MAG: D-arabino 3-hexulose 6-phosphate formaldehyde lyase (Hps-1) [Archaeoglobus fulgidus]KUK06754.1 MAG: D-arabino 3-hexulose 6-phosphate formaldehyde lyase (Hps-1) [Archaeoglobus fulgidus]MDI3497537.1 3-hexulose-6-phosphate synthase / 6-phosp